MKSILVINAGSSSLKYQLIDIETEEVLAKGLCERIGIDGKLTYKPTNGEKLEKDASSSAHPFRAFRRPTAKSSKRMRR